MRKKIFLIFLATAALMMVGCNKQVFDTTYRFDRAIIRLPDGSLISGDVDSWRDFEDGDQLQIKIGGVTYLVHSANAVLIHGGTEDE